jgi:hypothetical protein
MTIKDRAAAITRAKKALAHLEKHPGTTQGQLGAARDQLNIVHNWATAREVYDAVAAIECIVLEAVRLARQAFPNRATEATRPSGPSAPPRTLKATDRETGIER